MNNSACDLNKSVCDLNKSACDLNKSACDLINLHVICMYLHLIFSIIENFKVNMLLNFTHLCYHRGWISGLAMLKTNSGVGVFMIVIGVLFMAMAGLGMLLIVRVRSLVPTKLYIHTYIHTYIHYRHFKHHLHLK